MRIKIRSFAKLSSSTVQELLRCCSVFLIGAALVLACSVALTSGATQQQEVLMRVNGDEVGVEEFRWFAGEERAGVIRYFQQKHQAGLEKGFWTRKYGGEIPREVLETNTVRRVIREKTEQGLFRELGLLEDTRFSSFLAALEKTNAEREQAVKSGRVVFGPV